MLVSEPLFAQQPPHRKEVPEAYSEAPGDAANRVAQAGHAAAHHAEPAQNIHAKGAAKSKRVDEAELQQLVAEENASRTKFPRYPGLERWELVEKMGDGAFSNVYRARDLQGDHAQVAIKVVRKYEMNNMQVSVYGLGFFYPVPFLHFLLPTMFVCCPLSPSPSPSWSPDLDCAMSLMPFVPPASWLLRRHLFQHSNLRGAHPL